MNPEKRKLGPAEQQEVSDKAKQWANEAITGAKNQESKDDHSNNLNLNAEVDIDHSNDLTQLSSEKLKERTGEAIAKLKSATPGTDEYEEAFQEVLAITNEKNDRYRNDPKNQEKSAEESVNQAIAANEQPEVPPNPITDPEEGEKGGLSLREKFKKTKVWKKVVQGALAGMVAIGVFGVGINALNNMKKDQAFADKGKAEQKVNQTKMHEMANGIQYNYDGLFGDAGGYGYNQEKTGQWDFAPSHVLGNVWQDEEGTRQALIDLVEKQPDLNGADYLCGLDDGDLNKIDMTKEHGAKLDTISEWMGSDKEFHDEATDLLKDIFNDPDTVVEFGPLTKWSAAGSYVNAGGVISDTATLNDMNNVKIVGSNTQEDEHTAVIHIKTKAGSELLIKAGSFDENGQFVQEDGCAQLIWTFEAAGKVFESVAPNPDTPYTPYTPDTPEEEIAQKNIQAEYYNAVNGTQATLTQTQVTEDQKTVDPGYGGNPEKQQTETPEQKQAAETEADSYLNRIQTGTPNTNVHSTIN